MGGLSITQFDFQLVDTASHRLQLFYLSAKAFSGGEAFVELSDLFPEDADFLLQDFAGLFGRLTSLLRRTEFIRVGSRADVKRIDPLISFGEKLFELLNPTTMSGFSVTQFHFQQMDTILCRFQLLHADSDLIPVRQPRIELSNMFAQHANLFLQDLASLLSSPKLFRLGRNDRLQLTRLLLCCDSISLYLRHAFRSEGQFCLKRLDLLAARDELSLG